MTRTNKRIVYGLISLIFLSLAVISYYEFQPSKLKKRSKRRILPKFENVGIDISRHNDVKNWKKIKSNVDFCIMKSTEGRTLKDRTFDDNWKMAKKNKVTRGAYHFFTAKPSAVKQFDNFKNVVELNKGDLPPVLDVEMKGTNMKEVNKWLRLAEKHYKMTPIVYTGYNFFRKYMDGKLDPKYPLWICDINSSSAPYIDGYNVIIWQYSHTGVVKGINGDVDMNTFLIDSTSVIKLRKK